MNIHTSRLRGHVRRVAIGVGVLSLVPLGLSTAQAGSTCRPTRGRRHDAVLGRPRLRGGDGDRLRRHRPATRRLGHRPGRRQRLRAHRRRRAGDVLRRRSDRGDDGPDHRPRRRRSARRHRPSSGRRQHRRSDRGRGRLHHRPRHRRRDTPSERRSIRRSSQRPSASTSTPPSTASASVPAPGRTCASTPTPGPSARTPTPVHRRSTASSAFADGDPNVGAAPSVVGAAYTNSVAGATRTQLYVVDAATGSLAMQMPPNDGILNTVGLARCRSSRRRVVRHRGERRRPARRAVRCVRRRSRPRGNADVRPRLRRRADRR